MIAMSLMTQGMFLFKFLTDIFWLKKKFTDGLRNKLKIAFQMYDTDKNGYIDKKEMENVIVAVYELVGETDINFLSVKKQVQDLFLKLDSDSDGFISENEFIEGYLNDSTLSKLINESSKFKWW